MARTHFTPTNPRAIAPQANPAARAVKAMSAGERAALDAVYGPLVPLTDAERAEFASAKARVMAADEARRAPSPQLDLDAAA